MPSSSPPEHGYGSHRPESFSAYYKRSILSEGCSCAERVLDSSNRTGEGGVLLGALIAAPLTVWRWLKRRS